MSRIFIVVSVLGLGSCSIGLVDKTALLVATVKGRRARKLPSWATLAGYEQMFESITAGIENEFNTYLKASGAIAATLLYFEQARTRFGAEVFNIAKSKSNRRDKKQRLQSATKVFKASSDSARSVFTTASLIAAGDQPGLLLTLEEFEKQRDGVMAVASSLVINDFDVCVKLGRSFDSFISQHREIRSALKIVLDSKMEVWVRENRDFRVKASLIETYRRLDLKLLELASGMCSGFPIDNDAMLVPLTMLDTVDDSISNISLQFIESADRRMSRECVVRAWRVLGGKDDVLAKRVNRRRLFNLQVKSALAGIRHFKAV